MSQSELNEHHHTIVLGEHEPRDALLYDMLSHRLQESALPIIFITSTRQAFEQDAIQQLAENAERIHYATRIDHSPSCQWTFFEDDDPQARYQRLVDFLEMNYAKNLKSIHLSHQLQTLLRQAVKQHQSLRDVVAHIQQPKPSRSLPKRLHELVSRLHPEKNKRMLSMEKIFNQKAMLYLSVDNKDVVSLRLLQFFILDFLQTVHEKKQNALQAHLFWGLRSLAPFPDVFYVMDALTVAENDGFSLVWGSRYDGSKEKIKPHLVPLFQRYWICGFEAEEDGYPSIEINNYFQDVELEWYKNDRYFGLVASDTFNAKLFFPPELPEEFKRQPKVIRHNVLQPSHAAGIYTHF